MRNSKNRKSVILLVLALILLSACIGWYVQYRSERQARVAVASEAVQLALEANGALENESFSVGKDDQGDLVFGFDAAIPRYEKIRDLLPNELLPVRNLAIAKMLKLKAVSSQTGVSDSENTDAQNGDAQQKSSSDPKQLQKDAIAAIQEYVASTETAVGHWMQGHMLELASVPKSMQGKVVEEYLQAARMEPGNVKFWYAVYEYIVKFQVQGMDDKKNEALANLQRLEPNNQVVMLSTLIEKASNDPSSFPDYWKKVRPELERANRIVVNSLGKEQISTDSSHLIQQMDQLIQSGDKDSIVGLAIGLKSSLYSKDPYKTDVSRLVANPLDFLQNQFSDDIEQLASEVRPVFPADSNAANFKATAFDLPEVNVVDFVLVDVNFDAVVDAIVLCENRVLVLAGPLDLGTPPVLLDHPIEPSYRTITAAHLLMVPDGGNGVDRKMKAFNQVPEGTLTHVELPHVILGGQSGLKFFEMNWDSDMGHVLRDLPQPKDLEINNVRQMQLVDYDQDADLDLAVATDQGLRLLMNRSNNTFMDVSDWFQGDAADLKVKQIEIVDWDRDIDVDMMVLTDEGEVVLLENQLYGKFLSRPLAGLPTGVNCFALTELDGNASWDLVLQSKAGTNEADTNIVFSKTEEWGNVTLLPAVALKQNANLVGDWQIGDFDNDLATDWVAQVGESLQSVNGIITGNWMNVGGQRFHFDEAVQASKVVDAKVGQRMDLNGDGMLDLLLLQNDGLVAHINQTRNQNHWMEILPRGKGDNVSKTNHLGWGALLEVRVGDRYFATTVDRPTIHIGMGHAEKANLARIIWPNGIPQTLLMQKGDQIVEMLYILKGSCPFVYTWDGSAWAFFSDCLWAAPIGLQSSGGGLVPTRNWEYLRIDPDRMRPTDGTYRLMLTEELWEAAYFDHVKLQVIDHPADTEVQINDKVGPPSIVQHRLYAIGQKRLPMAAHDQNGNDVLATITEQDEIFFKGFTGRYAQGFVHPHFIELHLDDQIDQDSTLFLTGWIQPTDTSINVLLQQNPETNGPEFPELEVIGADGNWQALDRPIGFPGGKTKTMSIPLSGVFATSDHRLRIKTSCEIYWDQIYVAQTPQAASDSLIVRDCSLSSAELRYRGTSRRLPVVENGPERFDASDVTKSAVWSPMRGPFTRYGKVTEIVREADDKMVVLGTGDSVELRFEVPAEIPAGMKRTFLFYSVGYDKDADLNTLAGQSSLPLPFLSMQSYPEIQNTDANEASQAGSKLQRFQSWKQFWHQIRNPWTDRLEETKIPKSAFRPESN